MDKLIETINELQQLDNKYKFQNLELPQIIVIGSQSSGKSSVLERIVGHDILPKSAKVATRCPIILQLVFKDSKDDIIRAVFSDQRDSIHGAESISKELQRRTAEIGESEEKVRNDPIILKISGKNLPTLTLIDLPGMIKNDGDLPPGSIQKIQQLTDGYAEKKNSIILAISAANVDLANSDAISIAKKYDPEGRRTLNVITKIDLMDRGTTVTDFLNSNLLEKSLGVVCVINRSQESVTKKLSMKETNEEEVKFIKKNESDISGEHGIVVLISKLVNKLKEEIIKNIPEIQAIIIERREGLSSELKTDIPADKVYHVKSMLNTFKDEFRKMIHGDRYDYPDELIGGAKISVELYENFETRINSLSVTKQDKFTIQRLLKNTTGNRRMAYSIEKTFVNLIRKEIQQFLKPSLECNNKIKKHLKDFLQEIIKECNIDKYDALKKRIETQMDDHINKKHSITKMAIENIIRGEQEDIYCLHPNNNLFHAIDDRLKKKVSDIKCGIFNSIMDTVTKVGGVMLPPSVTLALNVAHQSGLLRGISDSMSKMMPSTNTVPEEPNEENTIKNTKRIMLKGSTINLQEIPKNRKELPNVPEKDNNEQPINKKEVSLSTESRIKENQLPEIIDAIINKTSPSEEHPADKNEILEYFMKEKRFPEVLGEIINKNENYKEDDNMDNNPNILVIEDMVEEYFKEVQANVIRNVPKWIQIIFITDLLKEIGLALHSIDLDVDVDALLNIDPEEVKKLKKKQEEYDDLESVLKKLSSIEQQNRSQ